MEQLKAGLGHVIISGGAAFFGAAMISTPYIPYAVRTAATVSRKHINKPYDTLIVCSRKQNRSTTALPECDQLDSFYTVELFTIYNQGVSLVTYSL